MAPADPSVARLARFLRRCADRLDGVSPPTIWDSPPDSAGGWLQYNLEVATPVPAFYRLLADTATAMLADGTAVDVFFVHKPPGVRLRCRTAATEPADARWRAGLAEGRRHGLLAGWRPAVYEPEQRLFGGPVSMRSVHRVFTADTVAWLGYHAHQPASSPVTARWAMSLLMIHGLLDALQIVGWEHIDVWDRLSRDGGRRLATEVAADPGMRRLADAIRAGWRDPAALRSRLSAAEQHLLDRYERDVRAEAARWLSDYFTAPGASVGVRHAAAVTVIFHWNRAGLPAHHQALLTEALLRTMPEAAA